MNTLHEAGASLHTDDAEARRRAASMLGSAKTERKAASSRENGKLGGRSMKALADIQCTCDGGDSTEHKTSCPRGRVIRYRLKKGLPLS